jgi:DNA helicase HerA-like ATPase
MQIKRYNWDCWARSTRSGTELRHVIFLDEAHKFFSKDDDDIINVMVREARKFGIGLWCASQNPTDFPDSFLTNVGLR